VNLYAYVVNRVVNAVDPRGTQHEDIGADPELQREAHAVHEARHDLDSPRPPPAPRRTVSKSQARAEANQAAAAVRRGQGMTDPAVQAGHTQAARHVPESGASRAQANDPSTFQQLHSRRGQGLDVTTTDPSGRTKTTTRHRAQEQVIDDAVAGARGGSPLTPEGQAAAGEQVLWRTQGTGFDQREVVAKRSGGLLDEAAAIERSAAVNARRARVAGAPEPTAGASPSPATGESGETPIGVGKGGALLGAAVNVAITALFTFAVEGRPPTAGEVAGAAYPPLALAQAKNHDDTVIPILTWFGGPAVLKAIASVPLLPQVVLATAGLTYGVPQASARGMAAHFLGAKGGYSNLVCYYPGVHPCN
jgi:hypothetical protein